VVFYIGIKKKVSKAEKVKPTVITSAGEVDENR